MVAGQSWKTCAPQRRSSASQRIAPGVEICSPRARRASAFLNERQTTKPKPAGIRNTIEIMNSTLVLMPAARFPPSEATASLQLSQA